MNEPFKPAGPEAVGKPFEILGSFFSSLGKKAGEKESRKQAFDDTVALHRELAKADTKEHGARLRQVAAHHKAMAEIASKSDTTVGTTKTSATYRTPKPVKEEEVKEDVKETPAVEAPASKPNKAKKASSTTPPKVKKAPAPKPTPKVDKERQELNESL